MNKSSGNHPTIFLFYLFLASSLMFVGCSTTKKQVSLKKLKEKPSAPSMVQFLKQNALVEDGMEAKLNLKYEDDYQSASASVNVKLIRDSVLWMSIRKIGIVELARVKITPDSVYLINRFERTYSILPLSYVENNFGIPASFKYIQDFILGNPILFEKDQYELTKKEDTFLLTGNSNQYFTRYEIEDNNLHVNKQAIQDLKDSAKSVEIKMEDRKEVSSKRNFSYLRRINAVSDEFGQLNISLNFSKVEFKVPTQIKFEISDRYKRESF